MQSRAHSKLGKLRNERRRASNPVNDVEHRLRTRALVRVRLVPEKWGGAVMRLFIVPYYHSSFRLLAAGNRHLAQPLFTRGLASSNLYPLFGLLDASHRCQR